MHRLPAETKIDTQLPPRRSTFAGQADVASFELVEETSQPHDFTKNEPRLRYPGFEVVVHASMVGLRGAGDKCPVWTPPACQQRLTVSDPFNGD